jgi:hypothetical protein
MTITVPDPITTEWADAVLAAYCAAAAEYAAELADEDRKDAA